MQIVKQSWQFEEEIDADKILKKLEAAGRTCWKSEDKCTQNSAGTFINNIMSKNHESVIEHHSITVRIITNRGVTHELVRHRIASYSQESTRYCNYSKDKFGNEITVILPVWFNDLSDNKRQQQFETWKRSNEQIEKDYFELLASGQTAQEARDVLPNSLKTEIVVTMNMRSWRHFFELRAAQAAHPQIRELAKDMLAGFKAKIPVIFDDL